MKSKLTALLAALTLALTLLFLFLFAGQAKASTFRAGTFETVSFSTFDDQFTATTFGMSETDRFDGSATSPFGGQFEV